MKILKQLCKERRIGEVFTYKGSSFICLESPNNSCQGCYFKNGINCTCGVDNIIKYKLECTLWNRSDGKSVYFEILTDENTKEKKN